MEAFMEYLVTSHFKDMGFIVENQISYSTINLLCIEIIPFFNPNLILIFNIFNKVIY
jgi:hypothetical protein